VSEAGTPADPSFIRDEGGLPVQSGAYVLLVDLPDEVVVRLPGRPLIRLQAGRYLYCGSAHGPGGLKARVSRHMRTAKTVRWHIDQVTAGGRVRGAWVFPDRSECDLVAMLSALPAPIPGFGSSDCRTCVSHLVYWPEGEPLSFSPPVNGIRRMLPHPQDPSLRSGWWNQ
jgi:Uri superfamily endonuclease